MHTRRTLNLDQRTWDLTLDGVGRIEMATEDYATAQNVANEARLFIEDAYFQQDQGIPHFVINLGHRLNPSLVRAYLRAAARRVPDVKEVLSVSYEELTPEARLLTGNIEFTTMEGVHHGVIRSYF